MPLQSSMTSPQVGLFNVVSGTVPGVIDSSQRERLLRTPSTVLCFATFDALTAVAGRTKVDDATSYISTRSGSRLSLEGKRIVVETDINTGTCTWRYIPRAKLASGDDEGIWPRLVRLCGNVVRMTQEQWDIHKLDPEYECIVYGTSAITTINRRLPTATDIPQDSASTGPSNGVRKTQEKTTSTPKSHVPAPMWGIKLPSQGPKKGTSSPRTTKRHETFHSPNEMSVDGDIFPDQTTPKAPKNKRPKPGTSKLFEKAQSTESSSSYTQSDSESDTDSIATKRTRIRDPLETRQELRSRKVNRERKRKTEQDARVQARRNAMRNQFWDQLGIPNELRDFSNIPDLEFEPEPDLYEKHPAAATAEATLSEETNEEEDRQAIVEESRRKLAELERDKPLWEEAARKRKEQELRDEEERRQAKVREEEEERQKAVYFQRKGQWELESQAREREMMKKSKGSEMFIASASTLAKGTIRWSAKTALERCIQTAAQFDSTQYDASNPLKFQSIPWPMLAVSFTINDVEWKAIESFFKIVEGCLSPKDFKDLVEKSHKRFHPDRWRSRRILLSVEDDLERDLLEVAGSTVAQALTPLWKKVTGRE